MKEDTPQTEPDVLKRFAQILGTTITYHRFDIPEQYGRGYCAGFIFNAHIRMFIFHYELHEDIVMENPDRDTAAKTILFKFQNIFPETETLPVGTPSKSIPSVLIATRNSGKETLIPIHTHTATINIEVDPTYLNGLFDPVLKSPVLQSLLDNAQPLLFEQMIYPSLQKIVDDMLRETTPELFKLFFLRVKAEELVCRLLMELEKREDRQIYPLSNKDIQTLYEVKASMLEHLDRPPVIGDLAMAAHMSPTKLKRCSGRFSETVSLITTRT